MWYPGNPQPRWYATGIGLEHLPKRPFFVIETKQPQDCIRTTEGVKDGRTPSRQLTFGNILSRPRLGMVGTAAGLRNQSTPPNEHRLDLPIQVACDSLFRKLKILRLRVHIVTVFTPRCPRGSLNSQFLTLSLSCQHGVSYQSITN